MNRRIRKELIRLGFEPHIERIKLNKASPRLLYLFFRRNNRIFCRNARLLNEVVDKLVIPDANNH